MEKKLPRDDSTSNIGSSEVLSMIPSRVLQEFHLRFDLRGSSRVVNTEILPGVPIRIPPADPVGIPSGVLMGIAEGRRSLYKNSTRSSYGNSSRNYTPSFLEFLHFFARIPSINGHSSKN